MSDLAAQLSEAPPRLRVGAHHIRVEAVGVFGPQHQLGVILDGYTTPSMSGPTDYLNELLLAPEHREQTLRIVDRWGLLVCRNVHSKHPSYRDVRGRSSRGRLSQGEYYHHDGCTGPTKPRVVEIRFPHQPIEREVATAVAPFPATLYAMLELSADSLAHDPAVQRALEQMREHGALPEASLDLVQAQVTRGLRRELDAESARSFFRRVDEFVRAYRRPWQMGESRLICNTHPKTGAIGTMQHRRAYLSPHTGGVPNGSLVKRWPAEELLDHSSNPQGS